MIPISRHASLTNLTSTEVTVATLLLLRFLESGFSMKGTPISTKGTPLHHRNARSLQFLSISSRLQSVLSCNYPQRVQDTLRTPYFVVTTVAFIITGVLYSLVTFQ